MLLIVAVLMTATVVVRMEVADADWRVCFDRNTSPEYRKLGFRIIALEAPARPTIGALLFPLLALPALLAIALARHPAPPILAFALLALPLAWTLLTWGESWHRCDRKGCTTCEFIAAWTLLIQLPLGLLLLAGLLVRRLFDVLWKTYVRAGAPAVEATRRAGPG